MSTLVAIAYPNQYWAGEVLKMLKDLRFHDLLDLRDAFYVTKDSDGDPKLHRSRSLTKKGAGWGALGALLVGVLFFVPMSGMVIGNTSGAILNKLADMGIDESFVKDLINHMQINSSAIFLLVRSSNPETVIEAILPYGGTILQTALQEDVKEKMQLRFNAAQVLS